MQNPVDHNVRDDLSHESKRLPMLDPRQDENTKIHPIIFTDTTQSTYEHHYDALL